MSPGTAAPHDLVLVLPRGLVALPTEAPGWAPVAAMVALGVAGTGLAFIAIGTLVRKGRCDPGLR